MNDLPFTLEQLRTFTILAKEKNFKKTGEKLYLSQPAVSLQIKNLELQLNTILLMRKQKKIKLTHSGKLLFSYGTKILKLCQKMRKSLLKNNKATNIFKITIGGNLFSSSYLIPRLVSIFKYKHPTVQITTIIDSRNNLKKQILNGNLNFAIFDSSLITNSLNNLFKISPYIKDEIILVIPKFHPLTSKKWININELYKLKFLKFPYYIEFQMYLDIILLKNNINLSKLNIMLELPSLESLKNAIKFNLGVAFLPLSSLFQDKEYFEFFHILRIEDLRLTQTFFTVQNISKFNKEFEEFLIP